MSDEEWGFFAPFVIEAEGDAMPISDIRPTGTAAPARQAQAPVSKMREPDFIAGLTVLASSAHHPLATFGTSASGRVPKETV